MEMESIRTISSAGFPVYLHGFSAIDSFLGRKSSTAVYILCGTDIADLARLFEDLRYPGSAIADAALNCGEKTVYFRCVDAQAFATTFAEDKTIDPRQHHRSSCKFLEFYQDCKTRRFYDPRGLYPLLRSIRDGNNATGTTDIFGDNTSGSAIADTAMILARYFPETSCSEIKKIAAAFLDPCHSPCKEEQRLLLTGLLEAANPVAGFELLKSTGYIGAYWPELAALDDVEQSKEFHPEGNVWKHTMETLRYRKVNGKAGHNRPSSPGSVFDIRLSLGLLLHDSGKPLSESTGGRRFNGHAELGEGLARRFLERLGFAPPLVNDVCYLVRNHMLPAALPRLPLTRTGEIMASPLFPTLLELYRCDESSSYKGLDGYYRSSAAYQAYLKYRHNVYRTADGKKLKRGQTGG